jgi:Flagellar biosynthesis protein, FliO
MELLKDYQQLIYMIGGALLALTLLYFIVRSFSRSVKGRRGARLGISEYHEIDKTRRLVLVRRDETEHLILIGGSQDLVIESNIGLEETPSHTFAQPPRMAPPPPAHMAPQPHMMQPHQMESDASAPHVMRPPPRPAVFGNRRPQVRPIEPGDDN